MGAMKELDSLPDIWPEEYRASDILVAKNTYLQAIKAERSVPTIQGHLNILSAFKKAKTLHESRRPYTLEQIKKHTERSEALEGLKEEFRTRLRKLRAGG